MPRISTTARSGMAATSTSALALRLLATSSLSSSSGAITVLLA
jgi:hypothetical protein